MHTFGPKGRFLTLRADHWNDEKLKEIHADKFLHCASSDVSRKQSMVSKLASRAPFKGDNSSNLEYHEMTLGIQVHALQCYRKLVLFSVFSGKDTNYLEGFLLENHFLTKMSRQLQYLSHFSHPSCMAALPHTLSRSLALGLTASLPGNTPYLRFFLKLTQFVQRLSACRHTLIVTLPADSEQRFLGYDGFLQQLRSFGPLLAKVRTHAAII